jgi:hypothetical protein
MGHAAAAGGPFYRVLGVAFCWLLDFNEVDVYGMVNDEVGLCHAGVWFQRRMFGAGRTKAALGSVASSMG